MYFLFLGIRRILLVSFLRLIKMDKPHKLFPLLRFLFFSENFSSIEKQLSFIAFSSEHPLLLTSLLPYGGEINRHAGAGEIGVG